MAEIIKAFKEHLPACRFIGKRYTEADREGGGFGAKWGEWFANGWFEQIEALGSLPENGDAYVGLMTCAADWADFDYCIGMFMPAGTDVQEGFVSKEMPESDVAICYIYGKEDGGDIYSQHEACCARYQTEGLWPPRATDGRVCFFERYNCPRFTTPDEKGNVILDYGCYI